MTLVTIGEFAQRTRLSPKALRLYDELGLVVPARVDPSSGYRFYSADQVEAARLVGLLRRLGMPLALISSVLRMEPADAASAVTGYWEQAESTMAERRALACYLQARLTGEDYAMYDIQTRSMPDRKLVTVTRHVHAAGMDAFVDEAFARMLPAGSGMGGTEGATFLTFYGEVSDDSDGPVELCRPVTADTPDSAIDGMPDLQFRTEPTHEEVFIRIGTDLSWPQVLPAYEALTSWVAEHKREAGPGLRQVFIVDSDATPPKLLALELTIALR